MRVKTSFEIFNLITDYPERVWTQGVTRLLSLAGSRIFGVRCLFASLFEKRDLHCAGSSRGAVVCAVPSALGVLR
jgi:hypothetical protein